MTATAMVGRYVLEKPIGRGGMAVVHAAVDTASGARVALKQLQPRELDKPLQRCLELFEREYHTLAQLAHPRIVAVIDYGRDSELPYYTMELLDGGDLLERSPLPWREACAVARDVCSALSLVHSRRMVYRDLSPRNVRCTSDGKAKLLDFGAMAPMGSSPSAVCTPSVASPEVVHRLPLDGRSDLYALGAMLYFTLVGRSAYPARNFQQLVQMWRQGPPRPPSELVPDVPAALDALVMDLLQIDPQLRPANAAEVSQRLCAIADLHSDEQVPVARAYLTTPVLVGRDRELALFDKVLARLSRKKVGGALLVRGEPGLGRSRVLDACVLSAKLAGLTAVRVAASASSEPFALAREIATQLFDTAPDDAMQAAVPHMAELRPFLPALAEPAPEPPAPSGAKDGGRQAQSALRSFLLDVAARRPLLVAVDDLDRFDADSRALVTLLAHRAASHPLVVLATSGLDREGEGEGSRLLAEACVTSVLAPLSADDTRTLLVSMFGDVPNLTALTARMHALAAGNPRNLMRLAQHLVDRGVVRFEDGVWVLPERVDGRELPETMAQAFQARVAALDDDARSLAAALAECPDQRFAFDECLMLTAHGDPARTLSSLDRLLSAEVVALAGHGYALASQSWIGPLASSVDSELHLRLARVFARRGDGLRAARHFFRGGREAEGLDVLIAFARESYVQTSASSEAYVQLLSTLPHDWLEIGARGVELCAAHGRPALDRLHIQIRFGSLFSQNDTCSDGHLAELAQRIARDAGLDDYAETDPALPAGERLRQALGAAAARYERTEPHDRGIDPKSAIGLLARTVITAIGNFSRTLDVDEWRRIPSLTPLAPLSPAVAVVDLLAQGFEARMTGRFEDAGAIYRKTIELLDSQQGGGLDPTFVDSMRAALPSILGMMEAALGRPECELHAAEVEAFPLYHGSALAIRMLAKLWQGDVAAADRLARERELWRLEQPRQQTSDVLTLLWTLQAHAASDDLTHTRRTLEAIERIASKIRTWQPIAAWARGEYERIRGDHAAALAWLDTALSHMPAGEHQTWPLAAGARVAVLCQQERYAEARAAGEEYLAIARVRGLGYLTNYIRMPLALAAAHLGDAAAAWLHAKAAIDGFHALGTLGINLGLAYETAARVAACLDDTPALQHYANLCKACYLAHPNPALAAKYQRLRRVARKKDGSALAVQPEEMPRSTAEFSELESVLLTCSTSQERLDRALQWVVQSAGADHGYLYGLIDGVPTLCGRTAAQPMPPEVEREALLLLERELSPEEEETATGNAGSSSSMRDEWQSKVDRCYRPVLLTHAGEEGIMVAGLIVLAFGCGRALRPVADMVTHVSRIVTEHGDLRACTIAR